VNGASEAQGATSMLRFNPYSAYRNSGVDWLGEIPSHWSISRLKHLAALNPESLPEETDPAREMTYVDIGGVDSLGRIVEKQQLTFASAPTRARRLVRNGDVIVSTVRTYLRAIAQIHDPEPEMVVSTGFAVVRPADGLSAAYAAYALRAPYFVDRVVANSKGVSFPAINESEMATYVLAVPPEAEQPAVATFLDRETARIDALVAENERLIELLQEKRTALITRAVSKGLDPDVPMKNSGVEWLGEIPIHWEGVKMWRISQAMSGGTPSKEERGYWNGEVPWVSPKDMKRRFIDSSEDSITERAIAETGLKLLAPPVVLIVVRGMILAHSFPVAITTVPVTINQDMKALTFRPIVNSAFMAWAFEGLGKALLAAIVEEAAHGTRAIRMDQWRSVTVPLPPASEQVAIAGFLDRETAKLDELVARVRSVIDRLKELRTALISAAVTGKIDVREEAV